MATNDNLNNLDSVQNNPYINQTKTNASTTNQNTNTQNLFTSFFNSGNAQQDFFKGAIIGAVATFILTNEDAQKAIFKGFAKLSSLFEVGIEELKERYEDAKAEVDSHKE
ncbi:YtxH domain-containing protein [uncultured Helicobacter sp.]|uniref:YtxH domain-containing protein n=1 Tax=uncultured Helicobacter sp. TaxID=175537 RepID=UPI001C3BA6BD|nr:YtxH domain-containing protein [Candidatus Helicobacter avicola]